MNKIILTIFILLVAVFSVAYLYFSNLNSGSKNNDKALSIIPKNAALIFGFKNDAAYYEIFKDYKLFDAITGSQNKAEFSALKREFLDLRPFRLISSDQNIFLSFHPQKDSIEFLWTMPLLKVLNRDDFMQTLNQQKNLQAKLISWNGIELIQVKLISINKLFYFYAYKGLISGSFSKELLQQVADTKVPKISKDFIAEINSGSLKNENSPATIYINLNTSKEFFSGFLRQKNPNGNFNLLNNLSGYTTLNMNYKSNALIFNGITIPDTVKSAYLNLFLHQKAITHPIIRVVPSNTAYFIAYGLSDYAVFARDLRNYHKKNNELVKLEEQISLINTETGIQPNRDIQNHWGNEFITFQLSTREKLGAIKLINGRQMQFFLQLLSSEYSENIWRLNYSGLFYNYFGEPFKQFKAPFYTIIDNHLIISNSPGSIQRFVSNYNLENQLFKTSKFTEFNRLVADESNILLFIHVKNSGDNINFLLKKSYASNITGNEHGFKDFYGLSYQWSSNADHFFTNFYAASKQLVDTSVENNLSQDTLRKN